MTDEDSDLIVQDTIVVKPPKYQVTIGKDIRETLGIEGQKAALDVEISLNRIIDDGGDT